MKLAYSLLMVCLCGLMSLPVATAEDKPTKKKTHAKEHAKKMKAKKVDLPDRGVAVLVPTKGNRIGGTILIQETEDALHLTGKVVGLSPGLHGFHIHQYGDLRGPQGKTAGGHFNPTNTKHGAPDDKHHHAGDLGNIEANANGVAMIDKKAPGLKLHFVLGRSIVVHQGADDLESQPSGDAGPRVAVGVIGIAQPSSAE